MDKDTITNNTATNALDIVLEDHAKMRELGKSIVKMTHENELRETFLMFMKVNTIHMFIEERVGDVSDREDIRHAIHEHNELKMLLLEAQQFNLHSQKTEFIELMKTVVHKNEHHVSEEEEKVLPVMRQIFEKSTMEELGKLWIELKGVAPHRPEKEQESLQKMKENGMSGKQ